MISLVMQVARLTITPPTVTGSRIATAVTTGPSNLEFDTQELGRRLGGRKLPGNSPTGSAGLVTELSCRRKGRP